MTKKENFATIREILVSGGYADELIAFVDHEVELLSKKKGSTKPTKRQIENEGLKERILGVLSDEGMTVTEIIATLGDDSLTNQRVSAILRLMGQNDGTVKKEIVKGKSLFTVA